MGLAGAQDYWRVGARVYFQRSPVGAVEGKFFDLGTVQSASPTIEPTEVELKDPDGGVNRTVAKEISEIAETYEVECNNFNPDNLALLFAADAPESFVQAGAAVVDVRHDQPTPGALIKLRTLPVVITDPARKGNSTPIYNIASIQSVKSEDGLTTYTVDDDYEIVSLARGIIRTIVGGTGNIETEDILRISYTPVALSGLRLVKPQTSGGSVEGELWIYYGRDNNARQTSRYAPSATIAPSGTSFTVDEFSSLTFNISILSDVTDESTPAGTLTAFLGDLPAIS
jgi:hypothetical protein